MIIRRALLEEIVDLRHRVLRAGLPRESAIFPADDGPTAIHVAAVEADEVVGCATLHLNEWQGKPAWQLRGMAVTPSHQRSGVGAKLLIAMETAAGESDVHELWCNARTPAAKFYERNGWQIVSEPFDIPSAGPHVKMIKTISQYNPSL